MDEKIDSGIRFARLMAARRTGMISKEDDRRLDEWLAEHPEFHQVYEEVMTWREEEESSPFSAEEAWEDFNERYALGFRGKRISLRSWMSVACGVAVVLSVGLWLLRKEEPVVRDRVPSVEKLAQAHLEMEDGTIVDLGEEAISRELEYGISINRKRGEVDYREQGGKSAEGTMKYHSISVPQYGEYSVWLSDGTEVKINSGGRLRYPVRFAEGVREVWLEGEAYFKVARDTAARFVVHTCRMDVNVLGTVFNVEAWSSAEVVRVTLLSGSVEVAWEEVKACLQPGEQSSIGEGDEGFKVRRVDTRAVTAWVRGMFYFDGETLEDIMANLADWYGFRVEYCHPAVKLRRFSVELKRYGSVDDVLKFMEETGAVRFERKGSLIKVY